MKITLATHNFKVNVFQERARNLCLHFSRRNVLKGFDKSARNSNIMVAVKVFAAANKDRTEFRFHINQYNEFRDFCNNFGFNEEAIEIIQKPIGQSEALNLIKDPKWQPRDKQIPVVEYITKEDATNRNRLVPLQTGEGKTVCALLGLHQDNKRSVIIIKPGYIDKWIKDIEKTFTNLKKGDVIVVQGSHELKNLLALAKEGSLTAKFIIVSNRTYQNWLSLHEELGCTLAAGYDCNPEDFFDFIKAQRLLRDEVHQDWHLNFKIELYTNVEKAIALSATLINNNPFLVKTYLISFPIEKRYKAHDLRKFIDATALIYNFKQNRVIRTKEFGSNNFSHHAVEKSIMKVPEVQSNYFKLIKETLDNFYLSEDYEYKKGEKAAVFCASVEMCTRLTNYLASQYPSLTVRRYAESDAYENLIDPDIRVTTIGSGGTAHDIPMLTTVVLTQFVSSIQSNVQTFGRLRDLTPIKTRFVYFVCEGIDKSMSYHIDKEKIMAERAKSYNKLYAPFNI